MKHVSILIAIVAITALIWVRQTTALKRERGQIERLDTVAAELHRDSENAASASQAAQTKLAQIRQEVQDRFAALQNATRDLVSNTVIPQPPDSAHQGGWPAGAAYFYLPKGFLTNANYRLLDGGHLTETAATLLGLSATEREATDKIFGDLLDQFHRAEIQHMQPIQPPASWAAATQFSPSVLQADSALAYHIPDLTADISDAKNMFLDQLQQTLGSSRAAIIDSAAESFLRQNVDDLGAGDRTIGFLWQPETDGSHSLWYGMADARHGEGSFQRVGPNVDPNSQVAYYARLFGVQLPNQ